MCYFIAAITCFNKQLAFKKLKHELTKEFSQYLQHFLMKKKIN